MIKIIADTTCGVPVSQLEEAGIAVLPQIITFGEEAYRDDTEINSETFLKKLADSKELPKTAAPPPVFYTPIYERILSAGDSALVITPSQKLSGTYRSAMVAAEEFKSDRIHVLDTQTIAGGLGVLVLLAKEWADAGMGMEDLKHNIAEMASRERVYFLVPTLEYLYKGGRIGGASRLFGTILQIKPILTIKEGQIEPFDRVRTFKQALANIEEMDYQICLNNPDAHLTLSHCGSEEEVKLLQDSLCSRLNIPSIPNYIIPPAIIVHVGPGLIETSCFVGK